MVIHVAGHVLVAGVAFAITTFAYGTMAYRAVAHTEEGPGLMELLDRYGVTIMSVELALLGVATFGAMWLDGVRSRQTERGKPGEREKVTASENKEQGR